MVKLSAFLYNKNFGNFKFDKKIHLTVDSKLKDMKKGCYQTKKPKKGRIVLWDKNKNGYYHLGFYWKKYYCE